MAIDGDSTAGVLSSAPTVTAADAGVHATVAPAIVDQAHQALVGQHDLQFDFTAFTPPSPPLWLRPLMDLLQALAPVFKIVFWAGAALGVTTILFFIVRELMGARWPWGRRKAKAKISMDDWRPDAARARTLLEDADRLAAEGRYDEAAHLLLFRSIEDIDGRWPGLVRPALTSRDIARLGPLPEAARRTFAAIAQVVERSLFGGQALNAGDFADCRRAYQAFALPAGA